MKLIVQIPCHNEEKTLPLVVKTIPRKIRGIDKIEVLVIDDGSTDGTLEIARKLKVDHIIHSAQNEGLASSFQKGIRHALLKKADIIVNTDGDNQYSSLDISRLIRPILDEECDIVIADRQTDLIEHFSPLKKFLQKFGSAVVRFLTLTDVTDAPSGFRAYSRPAAMFLNLSTNFSHTIETIFIASKYKIRIGEIKVRTNHKTRESRLFRSIWEHVWKSGKTIVKLYIRYL